MVEPGQRIEEETEITSLENNKNTSKQAHALAGICTVYT
jgi:hypothetical protein